MEGKLRRSKRDRNRITLPHKFNKLFFEEYTPPRKGEASGVIKNLKLLHSNPNIYRVDNFLSDKQLEYFDAVIKWNQNNNKFKASYVETEELERVESSERTSTFVSLTKSQDKFY